MGEHIMGTAATEAIRIAEKYLPNGPRERQKELAMEIGDAIGLCEAELTDLLTKKLEELIRRS